jgi:tricorn protease
LGYDKSRHEGIIPYPETSPKGPMVALINEYTGSDGDVFSHAFRNLDLGPLIGKRTWGGVVGIWPRHSLIEGTLTSQPEYSFWFHDVGWSVENYGVSPDIEVEILPQDYKNHVDPQLDTGICKLLKIVRENEADQRERETPPPTPVLSYSDTYGETSSTE